MDVSRETISKATDKVSAELEAWRNRPLDRVYAVVMIDAIVLKIRDGAVANRPVYTAVGINLEGERDILGTWVGTGGEGAKTWMNWLAELKNRGVLALRDAGASPCAHVTALVDRHLEDIDRRLAELQATKAVLRGLAERAAVTDPADCVDADVCRILTGAHRSRRR